MARATCPDCNRVMDGTNGCIHQYLQRTLEGHPYHVARIRYGDEDYGLGTLAHTTGKPCHDCATPPGGIHHAGCDWERCPQCGRQLLGCDCAWTHVACHDWELRPIDAAGAGAP